ncbi:MAG: hypothetical protein CL581_01840 [Alteromonadaceae bacterium]|nr:hypothetical protein [Alteromonadaceae bacterium]MBH87362.1 hypothetical protein [Alteromonadaceae bacterium]|tara:strand:- start:1812 stop:2162 length:351 start_codon:yes stop_codon:yes gene_type:complete
MNADAQMAYGIFWTIYVVAFIVFFILITRAIRPLPIYGLRTLIQAVLVVVLLTPVASPEAVDWWIPAWLHGGYESILGEAGEATRAFTNMALAGAVVGIVWVLDLVRVGIWRRKKD